MTALPFHFYTCLSPYTNSIFLLILSINHFHLYIRFSHYINSYSVDHFIFIIIYMYVPLIISNCDVLLYILPNQIKLRRCAYLNLHQSLLSYVLVSQSTDDLALTTFISSCIFKELSISIKLCVYVLLVLKNCLYPLNCVSMCCQS